jgi:hypothetical protein
MTTMTRLAMGAAVAGALLLGGCNTPPSGASLQAGISDCLINNPNYTQAWNCSRGLTGSTNEYRNVYIANGDAIQARVNSGEITDAQARASLSSGFADGGPMRGGGRGSGRR